MMAERDFVIQDEPRPISLDDLLKMGEDARVEIIDGELVKMPAAGGIHQLVARNVNRILDSYVSEKQIGEVFFDGLTYLMSSPAKGLKDSFVPDVSFIRAENIPADWDVSKPHPGVPDLAVEVISPGDDANIVQAKVRTYLNKGTEEVWLIYPTTKEVQQFRRADPNTARIYHGSQVVDASALFPGLESLTLGAIFKLPDWAIKDES